MMNFNELIGKKLSFPIYNSSGMGGNVEASTLVAVTQTPLVSAVVGQTPEYLHDVIKPHLPNGVGVTANDYDWLILRDPSGQLRAIGTIWINGPVVEDSRALIRITVRGKNLSDIPTIRAILGANGYSDVEITSEVI